MKKCSILFLIFAVSMGGIASAPAPAPGLLGGLINTVGTVVNVVSSAVLTLAQAVTNTLNGLVNGALNLLTELEQTLIAQVSRGLPLNIETLKNNLNLVQSILPTIQNAINLQNPTQGLQNITNALNSLVKVLNSTAAIVNSIIPNAIPQSFIDTVVKTVQSISAELTKIVSTNPSIALSQTMGDTLFEEIVDLLKKIVETISNAVESYTNVLNNSPVRAILNDVLNIGNQAAIEELKAFILGSIDISQLTSQLDALQSTLTGLLDQVQATVSGLVASLSSQLTGALSSGVPVVRQLDAVTSAISQVQTLIEGILNELFATIFGKLADLASTLSSIGSDNLSQLTDELKSTVDAFLAQPNESQLATLQCLVGTVAQLINIIVVAVDGLLLSVTNVVKAISDVLSSIPGEVTNLINGLVVDVKTCEQQFDPITNPQGFVDCFTEAANSTITSFSASLQQSVAALSSGGSIVTNFNTSVQGVVQKASQALEVFAASLAACASA